MPLLAPPVPQLVRFLGDGRLSSFSVKTGRLIKFRRVGAVIQAYVYKEGGRFRAAIYVLEAARPRKEAVHSIEGETEAIVEKDVRAWVDERFPPA